MTSRCSTCRSASWNCILGLLIVLGGFGPLGAEFHPVRQAVAQNAKSAAAEVPETVMNGWRWFHVYCFRCHGMDALGSQLAPNLRDSIQNLSHQEFSQIVREGKPKTAMSAWNKLLDDAQIEDIYQYVLARSEGRLGRGRPDEQ